MRSRELGVVLFGLAGLYTLLLAILGLAQLLPQVQTAGAVVGGQLRLQASFVNGLTSVLLHLIFGIALFAGRRRLADRLLGADEPARPTPPPAPAGMAIATAGVCAIAVLLVARVVTALSYGISLLVVRDNTGDIAGWTIGGILVDLLLTAAGLLLVARRTRVAALLFGLPRATGVPVSARAGATVDALGTAAGDGAWQLPAMRFLGLALLVWHLPALASALSVFVKWRLRPMGFDLRSQALFDLPPAATGVLAGAYFLLLFPAGLGGVWRRLRSSSQKEAM
jgi:hypothetical protein